MSAAARTTRILSDAGPPWGVGPPPERSFASAAPDSRCRGAPAAGGVVAGVRRKGNTRLARRLRDLPTVEVGGRRVPVAATRLARLLGLALLDEGAAGAGLLIPSCRSVHTFGMRFALDLVFLDGALGTVSVRRALPARRVATDRSARAVLELPAGALGGG
jgi:uncharacterized membrane protein (UPF0127 family)